MKWLAVALIAGLIGGCSAEAPSNETAQPADPEEASMSGSPSAENSDFRSAYVAGIEAIMFLGFCNPGSSGEGSAVMARWWSLTQQAHRQGLSGEVAAAQKDHAASIAVRRIVTTCPEGLDARIERTTAMLERVEALLKAHEEAS